MKYEAKFELGQRVFGIVHHHDVRRIVKCPTCDHTGKIIVKDQEFICPNCKGEATKPQRVEEGRWLPSWDGEGHVTLIEIEHRGASRIWSREPELTIKYQIANYCSVWNEDVLFASKEEAQSECDRRNGDPSKYENEVEAGTRLY